MHKESKPLSWKEKILLPFAIAFGLFSLIFRFVLRRLQGKPFGDRGLLLDMDEMGRLEQASHEGSAVFVEGRKKVLKPFNVEQQRVRWECGCCPDQLQIDDEYGRPCLSLSRERDQLVWSVTRMRPTLFGLLGHASTDLRSLHVGDRSLGSPEDGGRAS